MEESKQGGQGRGFGKQGADKAPGKRPAGRRDQGPPKEKEIYGPL